ncbi:MAG: AmmeMemoRadiSam system protein B [Puniceicoccaceae bacterium]|nr:AmmeMemoRadiSam system protein B [Puniceicoccaceae bacterium]
MDTIRNPAVAGLFYPDDRDELASTVDSFLLDAVGSVTAPKAIIAPHAGYQYSGPIAGSAFASVKPIADRINRVVLLGPSHRIAFTGLAVSSADAFQTPLGAIPLDRAAIDQVLPMEQVIELNQAHTLEHSLEVELPFLQVVLGKFTLVPLVVGDASFQEVAEVIDALWGGDETLIVVSSDLSHYLEYRQAQALDAKTRRAIETLQPEAIKPEQACGRIPIGGLLLSARKHGRHVTTLDMRSSGDTAGSKHKVVGYGAYAVH